MNRKALIAVGLLVSACATITIPGSVHDGLVDFAGGQSRIFETGKADPVLDLRDLQSASGLYAIGPVKNLDGEITIFDSNPQVSRVQGSGYAVQRSWDDSAIFLVWSRQREWKEVPIPPEIAGYLDLQKFVKAKAAANGIDTAKPFPFLVAGTPAEIKWHINVDRSEGKPITPDLFAKSKASYVTTGEPVDIVGFYSERHPGIFISKFAPAIQADSGQINAIHIHFVSRKSEASGHIDNIKLGDGLILRLPVPE